MTTSKIRATYIKWLIKRVTSGRHREKRSNYSKLFARLESAIFRWSVDRDYNRVCEGRDLRLLFCSLFGFEDSKFIQQEVSVFEVLVAVARRCDDSAYLDADNMTETEYHVGIAAWFWKLIDNLRLTEFVDSSFYEDEVDEILDIFMDRTYDRLGNGGLFPLKHSKNNQRKVEIWYQLSEYFADLYRNTK